MTVSVVTPILVGGLGGSLETSSRTLSSFVVATVVGVDVVGVGVTGPGEDSVSLLFRIPDMPGSLPRLDVDEVPEFILHFEL